MQTYTKNNENRKVKLLFCERLTIQAAASEYW